MFEGLVSDLLNRVLGTYVENLDGNNLKLSIWGGDVELRDLDIKKSALDELNLPLRPVFGHIRRLTLKIPWKNLFTSQWIAVVEGVYVIAVPNTSIEYDREKEEKLQHESKMSALQRAEEARQKAKEKEKGSSAKTEDGFTEKLLAQVVRNIQVTIQNIHIRYEDKVSSPGNVFAVGITLSDLSMKSTDANWKPCLDTDKFVYKLNSLDSLSLYWHPNAEMLSDEDLGSKDKKIECLHSLIASKDNSPQNMHYILGPICSTAKLTLNPKPEIGDVKFSHPKMLLDFVMDELCIGLSRHQYATMMALLDSLDRMKLSSLFRKYRPNCKTIKGHPREWWRYAYKCLLEDVQRTQNNWSWEHISRHRTLCKKYKVAYKAKLTARSLNTQQMQDIQEGEKSLDIFNIILVRRQAEMEVEREGEIRKQEQKQKGWFGGWFSWGSQQGSDASTEGSIVKKLESEMNDDEKKSLYKAIGYEESAVLAEYPEDYVDVCLQFLLKDLVLLITDEESGGATVTKASLSDVSSKVKKRSSADAVRIEASMKSFYVEGFATADSKPQLVSSEGSPLLEVMLETNPMDKRCDQRLIVEAQPLEIIYDAETINRLVQVFAPPKNISLQQLQAAALNQLEVVKERSATGLQNVIDNQSILDLDVCFAASHIVIPEGGLYHQGCSALVLTLGSMKMISVPRDRKAPGVADLVSLGLTQQEVTEAIRNSSYDCFTIELIDIQAVIAYEDEDWRPYLNCHNTTSTTPLHLLAPTTLHVDMFKCLLTDDPNLAKVKINASLPNVALSVIDERLLHLAHIANSIPKATVPEEFEEEKVVDQDKDLNMNLIMEGRDIARLERTELNPSGEQQNTPQFTNLSVIFTVNEISLEVKKATKEKEEPLVKLAALSASVELTQKTFDLTCLVILGGVLVEHMGQHDCQRLLSTPMADGGSQALLTLKFIQVNPKSPDFRTKYESTLQLLCVDVSHLKARLEQSAILSILTFWDQLSLRLSKVGVADQSPPKGSSLEANVTRPDSLEQASIVTPKSLTSQVDKKSTSELSENKDQSSIGSSKKKDAMDVVNLRVISKLGKVAVVISLGNREVAKVDVAGLIVNVEMKGEDITITSKLKDFTVIDPSPPALHPKIVEVVGAEAWDAEVSVYGKATEGLQYLDMKRVDTSITLTFGCARIVFLNKFVMDVLNWIDKFQMAKAAIASAGVAAAAAAQASLQDAYAQCSRVSLALTLRAPLILIPQDSRSLSGLMVDLGQITINNKFELGEERNELGYPAIYDKINLELHNVKLSRVELSENGSLDQEYELLQPISLTISVCRNLTISWNTQKPELEIKAHLKPIKVSLSEEDLLVTLTVLQDNLSEQTTPSVASSTGLPVQTESAETSHDVELALAEHGLIFTKVKFSFTIETISLSLLTGGQGLTRAASVSSEASNVSKPSFSSALETLPAETPSATSEDSSVTALEYASASNLPRVAISGGKRSQNVHQFSVSSENSCVGSMRKTSIASGSGLAPLRALAELSLQVVTLKGEMLSDSSLSANLVLYDCILQDSRPGRAGYITRMMQRSKKGSSGMIDLTYRQGSSNDTFVDVRISEFTLVLHLPYLLSIQRFFTDNLPQQPENRPAKVREVKRQKSYNSNNGDVRPHSLMTVRIKLEKPDIALVEDVSTTETSCIILHAEMNSDVKITPSDQSINACITNIQMYTCCYNPDKRRETTSQILSRCEVNFHSSATPSHADHIDIKISDIDLRVSPGTIELLSNIAMGISNLENEEIDTSNVFNNWFDLWAPKPLNPSDFPFLIVEEAQEAMIGDEENAVIPCLSGPGGEMALVDMEYVLITLEAGSGSAPIPLVKLQASASITSTGFRSQKLEVNGNSKIELAYYNPRLAVWEPLLEPVEISDIRGTPEFHPWELDFEMSQELTSSQVNTPSVSPAVSPTTPPDIDETDFEELALQQAVTTLSITARAPLQLTMTRTFFEVLTSLSEAFTDAYKRQLTARDTLTAPYRIVNYTGMHINVVVKGSDFQVATEGGENVDEVTVESGAEVEVKQVIQKHTRASSLVSDCVADKDRTIKITIPSLASSCNIPVSRADRRYFQIENKRSGEKWGLVVAISVNGGCRIITLSSCVQVKNNLDVSVDVYYMTERGNEVEFVLTLDPDKEALLPLRAVYTPSAELFFSVEGHSVCIVPFVWRGLQNTPGFTQELQCLPRDVHEVHAVPFYISATGDVEQILWENTNRRTMSSALHKIQLWPCIKLTNALPIPVALEPPGTLTSRVLMPGTSIQLTKARLGSMYLELQLMDYQYRDWICGKAIEASPPELSVWTFESRGDQINGPLYLDLGMHVSRTKSTLSLTIYCPFWMVNKTGLMLTYRGDALNNIVVHEEDNHEPVLFSFKSKSFFGKKKATVKVNDSDWSERFSLDVVGSSGSITCKGPSRTYQLGVDVKLGNSGLTKLVIFSPFYKILNKAKYDLEVIEVGVPSAEWFTVLSGECIGWWPVGSGRLIRVRVRGTEEMTQPMSYHRPLAILLKLSNMYGGVMTEVSHSEGGVLITLDECFDGATTALIINQLTNTTVTFWQDDQEAKKLELAPQTVQHYTWSVPAASDLRMAWACGAGKPTIHSLEKDDQGTMNDSTIHWVVFLNGNQRCLLFTDDIEIASAALNAVELERIQQEIKISLNCIGLSLVNDITRKEVTYISLASSGVVWEHCKLKGKKHRPFTQDQTENLEKCYQMYQKLLQGDVQSSVISHYVISKNLEVDYITMTVSKPFNRKIRRTFHPGVWLELRTSPHQRHIHFKINSVQIDNQLGGSMFPVVFARVPPPRSVMAETVPKPFCEVSIVQRLTSPVFTQYKYFAVLVQEFHVKVELPFVYAIQEVVFPASETSTNLYSPKGYDQDIKQVREPLEDTVKGQVSGGQKDYFDHLHLSPIKMHLSFSLSGTESGSSIPVAGQVLHLFLESVGVTLTEVQDLVFRLAYMERMHVWMNWNQFVQELTSHYAGQVIKQLYVLVLGLDVIGNPFGLVVGLTKGVEDLFYEPIQGAIEGPGEFAEGIVYGVTSFLGKTVGGAAGTVSRITGTLGKGIAALTLDDDYQRKRREAMNRKPADGLETIARGTKGVVTGVFDGVTGVVMRPIEGAREQGVEGFFKGVGKGMVGLVARPVSGVVDFASTSLDAVTRATTSGDEIAQRRPPRFISSDGIVRPFVKRYADGAKMLKELEKGRYAETDVYVAHAYVTGSKSVLIATDKRVMFVTRNDIMGHIKVDWVHIYEELSEPPVLTPKGLRLSVKQEKKRVLGVFGGGDNSKVIHLNDPDQAKWFQEEIARAYLKANPPAS